MVTLDNQMKICILISLIIGILLGIVMCYGFALGLIEAIGDSIKIESINTTVTINQTMLMDAIERMNQSRIP